MTSHNCLLLESLSIPTSLDPVCGALSCSREPGKENYDRHEFCRWIEEFRSKGNFTWTPKLYANIGSLEDKTRTSREGGMDAYAAYRGYGCKISKPIPEQWMLAPQSATRECALSGDNESTPRRRRQSPPSVIALCSGRLSHGSHPGYFPVLIRMTIQLDNHIGKFARLLWRTNALGPICH